MWSLKKKYLKTYGAVKPRSMMGPDEQDGRVHFAFYSTPHEASVARQRGKWRNTEWGGHVNWQKL